MEARIIHVSDAYDAMTTSRSYRRGLSHERAVAELMKYAGIQFDPEVVAVFLNLPQELFGGLPAQWMGTGELVGAGVA